MYATGFVKISVLLFYRRVVDGTCSRRYKISVWIAIAFVLLYSVVFTILLLTNCTPVSAAWLRYSLTYTKNYKCVSAATEATKTVVWGALSIFSDFYSVVLPAFILLRLKMSFKQKLGLYSVFGLGFL